MQNAGLKLEDSAIIDEPNAAFVSHLLDSLEISDGIVNSFKDRSANALVFDFGAGTCDISVLQVSGNEKRLVSRNLAISQFRVLGGDNIDRQIARKILLPRILEDCLGSGQRLRQAQIEQVVMPRLQPAAEQLKIQCCRWITARSQGGSFAPIRDSEETVEAKAILPIRIGDISLKLEHPKISLREFFEVMEPFLSEHWKDRDDPEAISILEPIQDALSKAGITKDELNLVLFIGGSAQNPLVQEAVRNYMGRFVDCLIGEDVRTPVSRGAALHSLAWNGLELQFIRPITSETIYILAAGDTLHPVIQAGCPIPSPEVTFTDGLVVAHDGQKTVELPICVSTSSKVLHTLELRPPDGEIFHAGDRITVSAHLDENKLLHVQAKLGQSMTRGELINPLANAALTQKEMRRLTARQALNESMVTNGGRPDHAAIEEFAEACAETGAHFEAAETFEALDRMRPEGRTDTFATKICYHYSRCEKTDLSDEWAAEAYRRKPTWPSAYNLALVRKANGDPEGALELLREAHRLGPNQPTILQALGNELLAGIEPKQGEAMLKNALDTYRTYLKTGHMRPDDIVRARRIADQLDEQGFLNELSEHEKKRASRDAAFSEKNLAVSIRNQQVKD